MWITSAPQAAARDVVVTTPPVVPGIVLDTNVVLDWLWFGDRAMDGVAGAITGGRCHWWITAAMHDEVAHVLGCRLPPRPGSDAAAVRRDCLRWAHVVPAPALPPARRLPCRDPDDQIFIDLAVAMRSSWLVTRDRALLDLARQAAALGVAVVPPARWRTHAPPR